MTELRTISYGLVRYVENSERTSYDRTRNDKPLKEKLMAFTKGRDLAEEAADILYLADHVIREGAVRKVDLDRLPKGSSEVDRVKLANALMVIVDSYNRIKVASRRADNGTQYSLGLVLADFLSVIPRKTASRFLEAASDPNISQAVLKGELRYGVHGLEPEPYAIEATVLLPREVRIEIFREMVKKQKPGNQRALGFFRNIAANWTQSGRKLCGVDAIKASLPPEQAELKIGEVLEDITNTLGPIVRKQTPS